MREVCVSYYTEEEIFTAKALLHSHNPSLFGELVKRQDSKERTKEEANIDDLYDWFRKLDDSDISYTICAANMKRIPKYNPEEVDNITMLERILKLEETLKSDRDAHLNLISRTCKIEEKVFNGAESLENKINSVKNDLDKTGSQVTQVFNDVQNIDKEVKSQNTIIKDQLNSYAGAMKEKAMIKPSVTPPIALQVPDPSGWQIVNNNKRKKPALVVTARPSGSTSRKLGAPPPSRHFVIERVLNDTIEDDIVELIKSKNNTIDIRSVECMSHEDATYKTFKLEVSVEDCKAVYDPDLWDYGMRISPFYKKRITPLERMSNWNSRHQQQHQ